MTQDNEPIQDQTAGTAATVYSKKQTDVGAFGQDEEVRFSDFMPAKSASSVPMSEIGQVTLDAGARAPAASDSFKQVIALKQDGDAEGADAALSEAKDRLIDLWAYTHLRSSAFRSLLAAIDAGIRNRTIADFSDAQLECLNAAFGALPRASLEQRDVTAHLAAFAEADVDITAPLLSDPRSEFRVTIERIK